MNHRRTPAGTERATPRRTGTRGEREFHALLDAAVDAIIVIDHRGTVEEFSLAAERMFGYEADEVIGHNVSLLMPEPFRGEHDGHLERYAATRVTRIIGVGREIVSRRKNGTVFPCELAVGRIADAEPPRYVGFIRDLTRHKEAEEQLKRSEAELRLAQGLANLGNYVVHPHGDGPDYFSAQLYKILDVPVDGPGVTREEFFEKWVHASDRVRVLDAFHRLDAGGAPLDIEYQVVLRDGRTRHLHHIAQAVLGENGQVLKHVGTIHDITDRHHAEDEARQLQERLTHFSRLSTMGEMAAGLAHEINQPLSAIATYAQACQRILRQDEPDVADVAVALEQINAQALRAGEVIRRLRNFVRNREVKREWVDCGRLLDDLRTLAETDARLHNVQLRIDARRACRRSTPTRSSCSRSSSTSCAMRSTPWPIARRVDARSCSRPAARRRARSRSRSPTRGAGWRRGRRSISSTRSSPPRRAARDSGSRSAGRSCGPTAGGCGTLPTGNSARDSISRCRPHQ